jgi:hypothetical protein
MAPKKPSDCPNLPLAEQGTNPATGDLLASLSQRLKHVNLVPKLRPKLSKTRHIALTLVTECEISANPERAKPKVTYQHLHKGPGWRFCQLVIKGQQEHHVHSQSL